jgi:hypothetical protein
MIFEFWKKTELVLSTSVSFFDQKLTGVHGVDTCHNVKKKKKQNKKLRRFDPWAKVKPPLWPMGVVQSPPRAKEYIYIYECVFGSWDGSATPKPAIGVV